MFNLKPSHKLALQLAVRLFLVVALCASTLLSATVSTLVLHRLHAQISAVEALDWSCQKCVPMRDFTRCVRCIRSQQSVDVKAQLIYEQITESLNERPWIGYWFGSHSWYETALVYSVKFLSSYYHYIVIVCIWVYATVGVMFWTNQLLSSFVLTLLDQRDRKVG